MTYIDLIRDNEEEAYWLDLQLCMYSDKEGPRKTPWNSPRNPPLKDAPLSLCQLSLQPQRLGGLHCVEGSVSSTNGVPLSRWESYHASFVLLLLLVFSFLALFFLFIICTYMCFLLKSNIYAKTACACLWVGEVVPEDLISSKNIMVNIISRVPLTEYRILCWSVFFCELMLIT